MSIFVSAKFPYIYVQTLKNKEKIFLRLTEELFSEMNPIAFIASSLIEVTLHLINWMNWSALIYLFPITITLKIK